MQFFKAENKRTAHNFRIKTNSVLCIRVLKRNTINMELSGENREIAG